MEKYEVLEKLKNAQNEIEEIIQLINNDKLTVVNDNNQYNVLKLLDIVKLWNKGYKGNGIKIGIIDRGFKSLKDKLSFSGMFNSDGEFKEYYGHGTQVASLIKGKETGAAPEAEIYACSYNDDMSPNQVKSIAKCIKWCIDNKMQIINMSIGIHPVIASLNPDYEKPLKELEAVCKEAEDKGIIVVCGAGNNGYKEDQEVTEYPGSFESTICVGSVDKNNNWSKFSSTGPTVNFVCYGENNEVYLENGTITKVSGTSFSAPIMTAIIALMLQQRNDLTKKDVMNILKTNAIDLGSIGKDHAYGYGLIKAIEVPADYLLLDQDDEEDSIDKNSFLKNQMNVINLHKIGITGKGVKIGLVGYGCSDYLDYNVYFYNNFSWNAVAGEGMTSALKPTGDIYGSAVLSKTIGLCPGSINYVLRDRSSYGGFAKADTGKVNQWCLNNKDKLDIVLVFPYTPVSVLKTLSEAGIICVMCCYDNSAALMEGSKGQNTNDENAITVGFVSPDKTIINDSIKKNNGYANEYMDCVAFGYGFDYRTDNGASENPEEIISFTDKTYEGAVFRALAAATQAMGVIALMKQQLPEMNTAKKVRRLLPYICEVLYGGKNNNTGYGLIKAANVSDLNLPTDLFQ